MSVVTGTWISHKHVSHYLYFLVVYVMQCVASTEYYRTMGHCVVLELVIENFLVLATAVFLHIHRCLKFASF